MSWFFHKNVTGAKAIAVIALLLFFSKFTFSQEYSAERLSFDKGWRFHEGDIPFPVITGHGMSYANAKAGKAWGAAASILTIATGACLIYRTTGP